MELINNGKIQDFSKWGADVLHDCMLLAKKWDQALCTNDKYQQAVSVQLKKLEDVTLTPSARVLDEARDFDGGYQAWVHAKSTQYAADFMKFELGPEFKHLFDQLVADSVTKWQQLERTEQGSFEEYMDHYFNSTRL